MYIDIDIDTDTDFHESCRIVIIPIIIISPNHTKM